LKTIINNWRSFLNEGKVLKEMHHIESMFLPEEFIDGLPRVVKGKVLEFEALDFAFERYKDVFKNNKLTSIPNKFFVPYGNDKEQFFDFSFDDDDPHHVARKPTEEELKERGKSIPVLPKDWYNAYLYRLDEPMIAEKKEKRDLSQVTTLAVFDFDDTLFKSTEAGERLGTDSHLSPDSLPDKARESDWNLDVAYKAQELCVNPTVYCVMMTGRIGDVFEEKINKLLSDKNIMFAETHYNEFGGDTAEFKKDTIHKIIDKLPNVRRLIMWEDQEEKAEKYTEEFADILQFKIHMVGQEKPK
jgi:hypothetical protein